MAEYLTNKQTQAALENIIMGARKELILVSPYIRMTTTWYARIKECANKGVKVRFIYRSSEVKEVELDKLRAIKNVEVKSIDDLHAKCYFNEEQMIITSFNLLDSSEKNWEMGILIKKESDKEIYEKASMDVQNIMNSSIPELNNLKNTGKLNSEKVYAEMKSGGGFCIRCSKGITFNIDKPFCFDCFNSWNEWEDNNDYPENYCHFSGESSKKNTSFSRPVLTKNWAKAQALMDDDLPF